MAAHQQTNIILKADGESFEGAEAILTRSSNYIRAQVDGQKNKFSSRVPFLKYLSPLDKTPITLDIPDATASSVQTYLNFVNDREIETAHPTSPTLGPAGVAHAYIDMLFLGIRMDNERFAKFAQDHLASHVQSSASIPIADLTEHFIHGIITVTAAHRAASYSGMLETVLTMLAERMNQDYTDRLTSTFTQAKESAEARIREAEQTNQLVYSQLDQSTQLVETLQKADTIGAYRAELDRLVEANRSQGDVVKELRTGMERILGEHANDMASLKLRMDSKDSDTAAAKLHATKLQNALEELITRLQGLFVGLDLEGLLRYTGLLGPTGLLGRTGLDTATRRSSAANSGQPGQISDDLLAVEAGPSTPGGRSAALTTTPADTSTKGTPDTPFTHPEPAKANTSPSKKRPQSPELGGEKKRVRFD